MFSLFGGFSALLLCFIIIIIIIIIILFFFVIFFFFLFIFLFFLLLSSFFPSSLSLSSSASLTWKQKKQDIKKERKEKKGKITTTAATTHSNSTQQTTTKQKQQQNMQQPQHQNTNKEKTTTAKQKRDPPKKGHQIATKLLTAQKSGRKLRTSQNAIKLQKQAFQKIKIQNFAKCIQKAIFIHTNIFKLVHLQDLWHNVTSKNPIFIRATPCLTGSRWTSPCNNSGLRFYKTELLPHGVCNLWLFGLSRDHHTVPLKCLFV